MAERIDNKENKNSELALEFLKLSKAQEETRRKNDEIWVLRGPSPLFGDEIEVMRAIESRIEQGMRKGFSNADWKELVESMRDSLAVMQRQINCCIERINGEASAAEKIIRIFQKRN